MGEAKQSSGLAAFTTPKENKRKKRKNFSHQISWPIQEE